MYIVFYYNDNNKKTIKILCILLMNYDFLFVSIFSWKFTPATKWIEVII